MARSIRNALAVAGSAALLAACAAGPYDNGYGYNGYNGYAPGPFDAPAGYAYDYGAPRVGVGVDFSGVERIDGDRRYNEERGGRRGDWHGGDRDRGDGGHDHDRGGDRDGDHHR